MFLPQGQGLGGRQWSFHLSVHTAVILVAGSRTAPADATGRRGEERMAKELTGKQLKKKRKKARKSRKVGKKS